MGYTMRGLRTARGFGCGSDMASVADLSLRTQTRGIGQLDLRARLHRKL